MTTKVLSIFSSVRVGKEKYFPGHKYSDAILYFVNGLERSRKDIFANPRIIFGTVTLALNLNKGEFIGFGRPEGSTHPTFGPNETILVDNEQLLVERGLRKFATDSTKKMLIIGFPDRSRIYLWKLDDEGFAISGKDLPRI